MRKGEIFKGGTEELEEFLEGNKKIDVKRTKKSGRKKGNEDNAAHLELAEQELKRKKEEEKFARNRDKIEKKKNNGYDGGKNLRNTEKPEKLEIEKTTDEKMPKAAVIQEAEKSDTGIKVLQDKPEKDILEIDLQNRNKEIEIETLEGEKKDWEKHLITLDEKTNESMKFEREKGDSEYERSVREKIEANRRYANEKISEINAEIANLKEEKKEELVKQPDTISENGVNSEYQPESLMEGIIKNKRQTQWEVNQDIRKAAESKTQEPAEKLQETREKLKKEYKEIKSENPLDDKDAKIAELEAEKADLEEKLTKAEARLTEMEVKDSEKEKMLITSIAETKEKMGLDSVKTDDETKNETNFEKIKNTLEKVKDTFKKHPKASLMLVGGLYATGAFLAGASGGVAGAPVYFGIKSLLLKAGFEGVFLPYMGGGSAVIGGYAAGAVSKWIMEKSGVVKSDKDVANAAKELIEKFENPKIEQPAIIEPPVETPVKKEGFWGKMKNIKNKIFSGLKEESLKEESLMEKIKRIKSKDEIAEKPEEIIKSAEDRSVIHSVDHIIKVAEPNVIDVIDGSGGGELTHEEKEEMRKIAEDNKIDIISSSAEVKKEKNELEFGKPITKGIFTGKRPPEESLESPNEVLKEKTDEVKDVTRTEVVEKKEDKEKLKEGLLRYVEIALDKFKKGETGGKEIFEFAIGVNNRFNKYGIESIQLIVDKICSYNEKIRGQMVDAMIEYAKSKNIEREKIRELCYYFEPDFHIGKAETYKWLVGQEMEEKNQEKIEVKKVYDLSKLPEDLDNIKLFLGKGGEGRWNKALITLFAIIGNDFILPSVFELEYNVSADKENNRAKIDFFPKVGDKKIKMTIDMEFDDQNKSIKILEISGNSNIK